MNKAQAGRLGGQKTAKKHGRAYMRAIGRRGALAFHAKYRLEKLGTGDFAIVERSTGHWTGKTINGRNTP